MKHDIRETEAVSRAYDKYADMLYRIALSHLQSEHDAQDALHDVFEKYILNNREFTGDEHEQAWFIRVTVNRCLDLIRKRKVRNHISLEDISERLVHESGLDKSEQLSVMEHLSQIPEKNRSVIILHYLEGFSVEETARILKISNSAVKMRLQRGRKYLSEKIKEE